MGFGGFCIERHDKAKPRGSMWKKPETGTDRCWFFFSHLLCLSDRPVSTVILIRTTEPGAKCSEKPSENFVYLAQNTRRKMHF